MIMTQNMKTLFCLFATLTTFVVASCAENKTGKETKAAEEVGNTVINIDLGSDITQVRIATIAGFDQMYLLEEGKLVVEIPTDKASYGLIMDASGTYGTYFIPDGTEINISLDQNDIKMTSSPEGLNTAYVDYSMKLLDLTSAEEISSLTAQVIKQNPDNGLGLLLMMNVASYTCTPETLSELIDALQSPIRENEDIIAIENSLKSKTETAEGKKFVDFTVEHVYGYDRSVDPQPLKREVKFSDYVGKGTYVLVDFWSPWCGPCRREIPNIQKVYNEYKDKGLEVLSIAVWEREPQSHTIETAAELGMDWLHINNAGKVPTEIYGIDGIPHLMLIGPDGTILKRGFHGLQGIQDAVSEYIK